MAQDKAKYVSVWSNEFPLLAQKMNLLAADGYTFSGMQLQPVFAYPDGSTGGGGFYAVMKLDVGSYEGVTALADVDPVEVNARLAEGWEIASASISTKFVRMIKRRTCNQEKVLISPELRAQREASQ